MNTSSRTWTPNAEDPRSANDDYRLAALRLLEQDPSMSQRELAKALGVSLGKAHYLLRALLDKGLVKIENFARSDSKRRYVYLLTPSGVRHRIALTRSFLHKKEAEFNELQRLLELLRNELGAKGP